MTPRNQQFIDTGLVYTRTYREITGDDNMSALLPRKQISLGIMGNEHKVLPLPKKLFVIYSFWERGNQYPSIE